MSYLTEFQPSANPLPKSYAALAIAMHPATTPITTTALPPSISLSSVVVNSLKFSEIIVFHKFFWNLRLMKEINTTGQNCHNIKYKCKCGKSTSILNDKFFNSFHGIYHLSFTVSIF